MLYRQLARTLRATCVPRYGYYRSNTVAAAFCLPRRYTTSSSSSATSSISAADLQHACEILGLTTSCTDGEIKSAFQRYAKLHHPDLAEEEEKVSMKGEDGSTGASHKATTATAATQSERMIAGTEAYQLLRRLTAEERRFILREGVLYKNRNGQSDGDSSSSDRFTAEQRARAERAYYGSSRRSRSASNTYNAYDDNSSTFGSASGRPEDGWTPSQTAAFNQYQARARATQGHKGYYTVNNSSSSSNQQRHRRLFSGQGFSLYFFGVSREELRRLRRTQRETPGFAGIDGSRYDSPENTARAHIHPSLLEPTFRAFCLLRQRAQERLVVDRALGYPLLLTLTVVVFVAGVVLLRAQWKTMQRRRAQLTALCDDTSENKGAEVATTNIDNTSDNAQKVSSEEATQAGQPETELQPETEVVHGTVIPT